MREETVYRLLDATKEEVIKLMKEIQAMSGAIDASLYGQETRRLRRYAKMLIVRHRLDFRKYKSMFFDQEYKFIVSKLTDRPADKHHNQLSL